MDSDELAELYAIQYRHGNEDEWACFGITTAPLQHDSDNEDIGIMGFTFTSRKVAEDECARIAFDHERQAHEMFELVQAAAEAGHPLFKEVDKDQKYIRMVYRVVPLRVVSEGEAA